MNRLIPDARAFLANLAADNTRDWFQTHKADYDSHLKAPAKRLLDALAPRLTGLGGAPVTTKLYRIHRDLRFAKDKTPYNTHLHLQWTAAKGLPVVWMFGLSADYCCAGVGMMQFDKPQLATWRAAVADHAPALPTCRLDAPDLKRVPPPYGQDHPHGAWLKRKGLVAWHDLTRHEQTDPEQALAAAFERLDPVRGYLADLF